MNSKTSLKSAFILLLLFYSQITTAEQSKTVGDYTIHWSAFNSDVIKADIAKAYGLQRRSNSALLNISIRRKLPDYQSEPVAARVTGTIRNLVEQSKTLDFIEIKEPNAIYYISPFKIHNEETFRFSVQVMLPDQQEPTTVEFIQKFYIIE